jgi:hypothetical protein
MLARQDTVPNIVPTLDWKPLHAVAKADSVKGPYWPGKSTC